MICQGVRTRFLVYDDEWATLPPHAMFSISRLSLWLPAAQTLPSLTALPARLTVIQSLGVARDHLPAHTSTRTHRSQNHSCCCAQQEAGLYTAVKVFMAFRWTKSENKVWRESAIPPKSIWTAGRWNNTGSAVEACLTNEHRGGDENNKTATATFACWQRCIFTCDHAVRKANLYFRLHYLVPTLGPVTYEQRGV